MNPVDKSELQEKRILIIEDDWDMGQLLGSFFSKKGADVYLALDGRQGLRQFYDHRPDLILLDIMMPDISGWEVCRQIRRLSDAPIIFLTALGKAQDIIRGLDYGATDYVVKPIDLMVLKARVQAALRQTTHLDQAPAMGIYDDDYLKIDLNRQRVFVQGQQVKLSATEYKLLAYLFLNAGRMLTSEQILEKVWGLEYQNTSKYIHTYIWRLRRKIENDPDNPNYILTEHGFGYRFEKQPDD
jgi:DNA-binding response OmpR family regulator